MPHLPTISRALMSMEKERKKIEIGKILDFTDLNALAGPIITEMIEFVQQALRLMEDVNIAGKTVWIDKGHLATLALNLATLSAPSMLRTQLVRAAARATRQSNHHAARTFGTTQSRRAEVELTIGMEHHIENRYGNADVHCRWEEGVDRRYCYEFCGPIRSKLTIATAGSALIQACEKAGVTIPRWASFEDKMGYTDR